MLAKTILKNLADFFYPLRCASCETKLDAMNETGVCRDCETRIRKNPVPYCVSCGRSIDRAGSTCPECSRAGFAFEYARSVCLHEGVLKDLIHAFKYKGRIALAEPLSGLMINFLNENQYILENIAVITFVPGQRNRLMKRDYNQSEVLARKIARHFRIPAVGALKKIRNTRPQNELSREDRLTNLRGAFRARRNASLQGSAMLLIDDVMATGSTLNESSRALISIGASRIRCLTLSRGV
jgi:ComF family protein